MQGLVRVGESDEDIPVRTESRLEPRPELSVAVRVDGNSLEFGPRHGGPAALERRTDRSRTADPRPIRQDDGGDGSSPPRCVRGTPAGAREATGTGSDVPRGCPDDWALDSHLPCFVERCGPCVIRRSVGGRPRILAATPTLLPRRRVHLTTEVCPPTMGSKRS